MSSKKFTFPYNGWVLTPSYKPKQVTVTGEAVAYGLYREWHVTDTGNSYHHTHIHETREQAVAHGHAALDAQKLRIEKQQANLEKHRKNLMAPDKPAKPTRTAKN